MQETNLLYMLDSALSQAAAKIISISTHEDGRKIIVLDQTIFYPQGGGQRFDVGTISTPTSVFKVDEVRFVDGQVFHIGVFDKGMMEIGDEVELQIDSARRLLHSKLQSSGHLIDMAIKNIGYTDLKPTKGAHYPEWSEVEYQGEIAANEIESVVNRLQTEIDRMVAAGYEVKTEMSSLADAEKKCYLMPSHLPDNKPVRIVAVWDDKYLPCGGTHVKNIVELDGLKITKVKSKKGVTKVSYCIL